MKIAVELANTLARDGKDEDDDLAIPAGKLDPAAMLANLIAAGVIDPEEAEPSSTPAAEPAGA
ncbi:MAG: hypothetical protein RBU45_08730 [Myxococcota bacterium]|jgi:hypothetical protein|nr:hypothetical protein [Myxococcota bacterium]